MSIKGRWDQLTADAQQSLDQARWNSAVSLPHICPPEGHKAGQVLRKPNNGLAARGIINAAGKIDTALWSDLWFELDVEPQMRWQIDPKQYQSIKNILFIETVKVIALLESTHVLKKGTRCGAGFRTSANRGTLQLLVTGDVLESIGLRGTNDKPDFSLRHYTRDQYRTRRNSYGEAEEHVIRESINPLSLSTDQRAMAQLELKTNERPRDVDIYTYYEYQHLSGSWVLTQEINEREIFSTEHDEARIWGTPYDMEGGGHYGRGPIELYGGDFQANEHFSGRLKDWADLAVKLIPCAAPGTAVNLKLLEKNEPGVLLRNVRMNEGRPQDIGFLGLENKIADYGVVKQELTDIRADLSKVLLLDADSAPKGEAGRHSYAWKTTVDQLHGALGGVYYSIADHRQKPLVRAAMDMAVKARMMRKDFADASHVVSTSGIEAVGRQNRFTATMELAQLAQALGENAMGYINESVLLSLAARVKGVDEPGVVRTEQEMAAIRSQQMKEMAQAQLAQKAIDVGGNVSEAGQIAAQQQAA